MHEDLQRRLGQLDAAATARPAPDCPLETVWWGVAAGQLPDSQVADLLEHSTHCDACGLLLRQAIQDFTEEVADQEIGWLTTLPSAQQQWQQSLAQRLVAARTEGGQAGNLITVVSQWARSLTDRLPWHPRSAFRYTWAYATAAIVVLAAGVWFVQTRRQPAIDQLIASAYSERRPFELRIAGAAYGPVRQERGGERSALAEPASLLRAKYVIKERLAGRPDDEAMLAASGRVELLEGHYDEAIRTFGRMLDAQPDSPALLTDLATAYFQRAVATDHAIDYGQTIELLGRTLAKTPDDHVALFNRAIALQKMFAYQEAIRDWEHYLRVDPKGSWADEARRRLSELQEEMKARDRPAALLQSDPVTAAPLLRARATGLSPFPNPWPVSFDEEYLDLAVQRWLPSLYVSADSSGQHVWRREQGVWEALTATADVLRTRHKDPWLADLLRDLPADSAPANTGEPFVQALDFLARAAKANAAGDPDSAGPLAESAAHFFRTAKSDAGYLHAREEQIYSLLRTARIQDCLLASGTQLRETKLDSYPWLKAQVVLYRAACENHAGNLDQAQHLSEGALELTKSTGYIGQHLESVLFASGFLRSTERNLYNLLVAPFERHLEANRLLIVEPDSFLSDVPWPALVDGRGQYLGNQLAIVVSPGLSYWLNLRAATTISPEQTALVVGMPELASAVASRFSPLPDADREASSIAARFRHSRLLSGREVTSSAIRQELARSDVFHFAGHAVSGVKQSGLVLASPSESDENADEPRLLSESDLQSAMLQRLQLVVLSACATAETEKGFGVPDTLVRSFLRAGVPHVVASRWPVDSRTTQQTMIEFYKALFQGQPSTKALQQAANTLRLQPGTSHPYYWAAFGSYGR
jgi:tetratricopeptide (TPR) repeat protein